MIEFFNYKSCINEIQYSTKIDIGRAYLYFYRPIEVLKDLKTNRYVYFSYLKDGLSKIEKISEDEVHPVPGSRFLVKGTSGMDYDFFYFKSREKMIDFLKNHSDVPADSMARDRLRYTHVDNVHSGFYIL